MQARPTIVLVKIGQFSRTNHYVESTIRAHFPEFELGVIDLNWFLRRDPVLLSLGVVETIARTRSRLLNRKRSLRGNLITHLWESSYLYDTLPKKVETSIRARYPNTACIIQTQSSFSAVVPNIPTFVYTDSAALTNLYYKNFELGDLPPKGWIKRERRLYEEAALIFAWSNHVLRSLVDLYHVPQSKILNVGAGCNLDRLPSSSKPAPASNKNILFVGIDWSRKGGEKLVEAFSRLPDRHKDAQLLIVGCSPAIALPNCTVVGRVPPEQIGSYYERSAIFCMPTEVEPFGIAFIEAMSYSLTVVAPRLGAMPDYIEPTVTGMLHEPGDVAGILGCLVELLDHPERRIAMATRGFEVVAERYTWDAVGRKLRHAIGTYLGWGDRGMAPSDPAS